MAPKYFPSSHVFLKIKEVAQSDPDMRTTLARAGYYLFDIALDPISNHLGNLVAILLQHHHVSIAAYLLVLKPDVGVLDTSLRQELRGAMV